MHSSIIGKIEKAKRYAQERDRVTFREFMVQFRGENDTHTIGYKEGKWNCSCNFFSHWSVCGHTMALQKMLAEMIPTEVEDENGKLDILSSVR